MKFSSLLSILLVTETVLAGRYLGYISPYSFDSNYFHAPSWMTALPDSTNLTSLSIPGTHDTMTNAINGPVLQCQNHRLGTQLESGLRFFDIRARRVNNTLQIYHGDGFTGKSYTDVLTTFFSFLDQNPGETILMRLKEENTPINSTISFVEAFNYYRLINQKTAPGSKAHFWTPPFPGGPAILPTLGTLRGKIIIFQNFGSEPAEYGIKWESPLLSIQDEYEIPDLYAGLDYKFAAVTGGLNAAKAGIETGDGKLYLGHLSASVGVLPIECAAGTMRSGVEGGVVGINDRTGAWLEQGGGGRTGVVIIDFPGKDLVQEVLERNQGLKIQTRLT